MKKLAALLITGLISTIAQAAHGSTEPSPITVPEIGNSVAVSNSGLALVSYLDLKQVAIIDTNGKTTTIDVGCSPVSVEISPTADFGWTVCYEDSSLYIIDVKKAELRVATIGLIKPIAISYLPLSKRIVVSGESGQITFLSARNLNDYGVIRQIDLVSNVAGVDYSRDEKYFYVVSDKGDYTRITVANGKQTKFNPGLANLYVYSASVSFTGDLLFLGGAFTNGSAVETAIISLSTTNGRLKEKVVLNTLENIQSATLVRAGLGKIFVRSAMGVGDQTDKTSVGFLPISAAGKLGSFSKTYVPNTFTSTLDVSYDGSTLFYNSMEPKVYWKKTEEHLNTRGISISGALTNSRFSIVGQAKALRPGTKLTIYIRDNSVAGSKFVGQRKTVTVSRTGWFTFSGSTNSSNLEIYVGSRSVKSEKLVLRAD